MRGTSLTLDIRSGRSIRQISMVMPGCTSRVDCIPSDWRNYMEFFRVSFMPNPTAMKEIPQMSMPGKLRME